MRVKLWEEKADGESRYEWDGPTNTEEKKLRLLTETLPPFCHFKADSAD